MARWDLTVRRDRFLATSCWRGRVLLVTPFPSRCQFPLPQRLRNCSMGVSYLGDTLLVLASEENGPCNATGVLALEEEGLGLSILESEDLAVATDVQLSL